MIEPYFNHKKIEMKTSDLGISNMEIVLNDGEVKSLNEEDLLCI